MQTVFIRFRSRYGLVFGVVGLLGLLLSACGGDSQTAADKVYNVGVYADASTIGFIARLDGLKDGMKALGYIEGKNINYNLVDTSKLPPDQEKVAQKEFAAKNYDAYWLMSTSNAVVLKDLIPQKPIVIAGIPDGVLSGLIKSIERPGGNITGVDNLNFKLTTKRLELLNKLDPTIKSVYLLYNNTVPIQSAYLPEIREAAGQLGIKLIEKSVASKDDSAKVVSQFKASEGQAVVPLGLGPFVLSANEFKTLVPNEKMVVVGTDRSNLPGGALFSYGANNYQLGKQSTEYLYKVLHGTDPGTLPILQADKIEFVVNQKIADQIGRKIPESIISSADEVV